MTVSYKEEKSDQYTGNGLNDWTRWREKAEIAASGQPVDDGSVIVLARVNPDGKIDGSVRHSAGPAAPGPLTVRRSVQHFASYEQGEHNNGALKPGKGGKRLMSLTTGQVKVKDDETNLPEVAIGPGLTVKVDTTLDKTVTITGNRERQDTAGKTLSIFRMRKDLF